MSKEKTEGGNGEVYGTGRDEGKRGMRGRISTECVRINMYVRVKHACVCVRTYSTRVNP